MKREAGTGVVQPQARECQGPSEPRRGKKDFSPEVFQGAGPCQPGFHAPGLRTMRAYFCYFKPLNCGDLRQQPQEATTFQTVLCPQHLLGPTGENAVPPDQAGVRPPHPHPPKGKAPPFPLAQIHSCLPTGPVMARGSNTVSLRFTQVRRV